MKHIFDHKQKLSNNATTVGPIASTRVSSLTCVFLIVLVLTSLESSADNCKRLLAEESTYEGASNHTFIETGVITIPNKKALIYVGAGHASQVLPIETPLATDSLLSCAGLVVINRRLGSHAMAHVFMLGYEQDIVKVTPVFQMLELWGAEFLEGADIVVVPGRGYSDSSRSASVILNAVKNYVKSQGITEGNAVLAESSESVEAKVASSGGKVLILSNTVTLDRRNSKRIFWPSSQYQKLFGNEPIANKVLSIMKVDSFK